MNFLLDYHIEILGSIYILIQFYTVYKLFFKTNLDTDNIDLMKRYIDRRL